MPTWTLTRCAHCGAQITQRDRGRPRRYCTPACRTAAYRVTKVTRTPQDNTSHPATHDAGAAPQHATPAPATKDGG